MTTSATKLGENSKKQADGDSHQQPQGPCVTGSAREKKKETMGAAPGSLRQTAGVPWKYGASSRGSAETGRGSAVPNDEERPKEPQAGSTLLGAE